MPVTTRRGFDLYYEVHGKGVDQTDATPLLLIMGMGGTCQGWTVLTTPDLSVDRPCIIFDNRGAGQSKDPGEPFSTRDLAEDALAVLDELGVARAHVMGGFLGGMVAQELAIAHPERVDKLVMVGTYARPDARRRAVLDLWKSMAEYGVSPELRIKNLLCWSLSNQTMEQTDIVERMWRYYEEEKPLDEKTYIRQAEACIAHDTLDRLQQIAAETLVVCGEHDILTPVSLARELAENIPNARLVTIPEAGHLVIVELAPRLNRLINRYLNDTWGT